METPREYTTEETNAIFAGMDEAMIEHIAYLEKIAPRCHMTPMQLDGCSDEQWWECRHCGHTKSA